MAEDLINDGGPVAAYRKQGRQRVRCSWLSCNVDDLTSQHCRYLARLMPLIREENTIVNGPDLFSQYDYYSKNKAVNEPYVRDQKLVGRIPFDEAGAPVSLIKAPIQDYIGCLTRVNNVRTLKNANTSQIVIRKLDIENLNGDVVELTLRDEMACTFAKNVYHQMERPVFIAVSFCKLSKYREVEAIRDQYRAQLKLNPSLDISEERCTDLDQEKNRNRFALSTLLQQNPDGYRAVRFTCEGTIIGINTARDWYYQSCSKCIRKVIDGNSARECGDYGPQPEPTCPPGQAPYIFKWLWKKLTVTAEGVILKGLLSKLEMKDARTINLKDEVEKIIRSGSGFVDVEIPFTPRAKRSALALIGDSGRIIGGPENVFCCSGKNGGPGEGTWGKTDRDF
ncbi:hypothetical protein Tco_0420747 [Tanacetum coccineum]